MKEKQETNSQNTVDTNDSKQTWHCDTYCRKVRHVSCEGENNVSADAPNLCPYFDEMLY